MHQDLHSGRNCAVGLSRMLKKVIIQNRNLPLGSGKTQSILHRFKTYRYLSFPADVNCHGVGVLLHRFAGGG